MPYGSRRAAQLGANIPELNRVCAPRYPGGGCPASPRGFFSGRFAALMRVQPKRLPRSTIPHGSLRPWALP
jgi:hypothetical protein